MRALLFTALLVAALPAGAADPTAPARGLAIYKERAFRPDTTAVLIEYASQRNHEAVSYVITLRGHRLTIPAGKAEILCLPYPGKGEATPEQAFALVSLARKRFPQFETQYRIYDHVWQEEAKRPRTEIAQEIARRAANEKTAGDFVTWVRSLLPEREAPKLPPNPLGPTALNPAKPEEKPVPASEPSPQAEEENPLRQLQEFYRLSGELSGQEQPEGFATAFSVTPTAPSRDSRRGFRSGTSR